MDLTAKRKGTGLSTRVFEGASGCEYLVFRDPRSNYHVFTEVEATAAARDCGSTIPTGPIAMWNELWEK